RDVADLGKTRRIHGARISAEHGRAPSRWRDDVEQRLDDRGLAGPVRPEQRENGPLRHCEIEAPEGGEATVNPPKVLRRDDASHVNQSLERCNGSSWIMRDQAECCTADCGLPAWP